MNKSNMQRYVVAALDVLQKSPLNEAGHVDKAMIGKFASFGPTVYDMGLKPAVMLYSNEQSDKKADRRPVLNAICDVMQKCYPESMREGESLLSYVKPMHGLNLYNAKEEILGICVALKLALRTFPTKPENIKATEGEAV
jgi:hypothetical protein